jgi:hypothetical protein
MVAASLNTLIIIGPSRSLITSEFSILQLYEWNMEGVVIDNTDRGIRDMKEGGFIAIHVNASEAKIYMNRAALKKLAEQLVVISQSDPKECHELHFGMFFSAHSEGDDLLLPEVRYSDGLADIFSKINIARHQELLASGEIPEESEISQFEITIMHVSNEAIEEEMLRENS